MYQTSPGRKRIGLSYFYGASAEYLSLVQKNPQSWAPISAIVQILKNKRALRELASFACGCKGAIFQFRESRSYFKILRWLGLSITFFFKFKTIITDRNPIHCVQREEEPTGQSGLELSVAWTYYVVYFGGPATNDDWRTKKKDFNLHGNSSDTDLVVRGTISERPAVIGQRGLRGISI